MTETEKLFNYRSGDVAKLLGISKSKVLDLVTKDKLKYEEQTEGQQYVFRPKNIEAYLKTLREKGKTEVRIISLLNIKGGVGKSSLVIFLATILRKMGFSVLVVDIDKQCNVTEFILGDKAPTSKQPYIKNIFRQDDLSIEEIIYRGRDGLDIIPANINLARIETVDLGDFTLFDDYVKENLLHKYDYVLIDNPTSLNDMVKAVLISTDYVIPAVIPARWSLDGFDFLEETINTLNRQYKMRRETMILGTICNMLTVKKSRKHMKKNEQALMMLKDSGEVPYDFETAVPNTTSYAQVIENEESILEANIETKYKKILVDLAFEIIERIHDIEKELRKKPA